MRCRSRSSGAGLIEVMLALALLAMATLSVSLMSVEASKASRAASSQQAAWRLVSELAVWLRARGDQALGGLPEDPASFLNNSGVSHDCYAQNCTAAEAAHFYLSDWCRRLSASVPGARLIVCHDQPATAEEKSVASGSHWSCDKNAADASVLWLKLGWPQAGAVDSAGDFAPRILLKLVRIW